MSTLRIGRVDEHRARWFTCGKEIGHVSPDARIEFLAMPLAAGAEVVVKAENIDRLEIVSEPRDHVRGIIKEHGMNSREELLNFFLHNIHSALIVFEHSNYIRHKVRPSLGANN
jgi:hypothetical protein